MNHHLVATLRICAGATVLFSAPGQSGESAPTEPVRVEIGERPTAAHPFTTIIANDGFIYRGGFPAISRDKSKIAIFFSDAAMSNAALVDVVRLSDKKRLKRMTLLSELEGYQGPDDALQQKLRERLTRINSYLEQDGYIPMPLLYEIPSYETRTWPEEEQFTRFERLVRVEYATATMTISSAETGQEQLRVQQPVRKLGVKNGNPMDDCIVQGMPIRGWVDETTQSVVIEIQYIGTRDSCEQPEEWLVKDLQ